MREAGFEQVGYPQSHRRHRRAPFRLAAVSRHEPCSAARAACAIAFRLGRDRADAGAPRRAVSARAASPARRCVARALRLLRRRDAPRAGCGRASGSPRRCRRWGRASSSSARRCRLRADLDRRGGRRPISRCCRTGCRPFPATRRAPPSSASSASRSTTLYRRSTTRPVAAASIAQVHLAVTTEGEEVAVKVLRPGIAAAFARDIALFHLARGAGRAARAALAPPEAASRWWRPWRNRCGSRWICASRRRRASELRENFAGRSRLSACRTSIGAAPARAGADARAGRRHPRRRPRRAARRRPRRARDHCARRRPPSSIRCSATASSTPICIPAICSSPRTARSSPSISASWAGSTARRASISPTCCWRS